MVKKRRIRGRDGGRSLQPVAERLEARTLQAAKPLAGGVDALALGDVNGDRVVDLIVAGHEGSNHTVTIYDGIGAKDSSTSTGVGVKVLAKLVNPLGANSGPLSIAVGDFNGDGVSELAVSAQTRANAGPAKLATYQFQLKGDPDSPLGQPVTFVPMAQPFVLPAATVNSLSLTSIDLNGDGTDEIVVGASKASTQALSVLSFGDGAWSQTSSISLPWKMSHGVGLSAGDLTGDGKDDLAAIDESSGRVTVLDGGSSTWTSSIAPLKRNNSGARVAVVANENAAGALVVTSGGDRTPTAAIVNWSTGKTQTIKPRSSPGSGALVPLGGGWVYQRSNIKIDGSFAVSDGPNTPTVLFGSTRGQSVVVQGFDASLRPSKADTTVEPVLGNAKKGATFYSLQAPDTFSETGQTKVDVSPLVAFPNLVYNSPYSIDLSSMPSSIYDGLWTSTPISTTTNDPWGPARVANTPPTIPSKDAVTWLQGRILAAYNTFNGQVTYQHHYDPRWLPRQGQPWNAATTGYQWPGVDCTNFTAFAYADALGITMNSVTPTQAAITSNADVTIPESIASHVNLQVLGPWTSYEAMVKDLQPGDILYINPSANTLAPGYVSDPSKVTHAITWLGNFGKGATEANQFLIIDSTVDDPPHVDADNHLIPTGVHIRPFSPPGSATNAWYASHVDHALRIIAD